MKIVYMCFVSNGFDNHFLSLACSSMSAEEFIPNVVREYWRAASTLKDAAAPYVIALNLETLQAQPLGIFRLERDGKLYGPMGRGTFSGKPEDPDDLRERAKKMLGG
jgi:hypothetical protein